MNVHLRPLSTRIYLLGGESVTRIVTMVWRPLSPYLKIGTPGTRTVSMLRSTSQDFDLRTGVLLIFVDQELEAGFDLGVSIYCGQASYERAFKV
jgi:hypothetical protein